MTSDISVGPIFVPGVPAPFATRREKEWRQTVADHVKVGWRGRRHIKQPYKIVLAFRLSPEKVDVTDIDNLLKPTIDGIGSVLFARARTGHQVPWNTEDHWIIQLVTEKSAEPDPKRVGVEVTVSEPS